MKAPKNRKFEYKILGGRGRNVAKRLFQIIQYARYNEVDFKEAWDAEEPWFD